MRRVWVAVVGACSVGAGCHGATREPPATRSAVEATRARADPARPWIDVEDELGEPPPPMAWPVPEDWVPARDFDPERQGLHAAIDRRSRFAVVSSELGDVSFVELPTQRVLARSRFYVVREGDEDAFLLEPRIARNGDFAILGTEFDARTVARYDGSDLLTLFPALDAAFDARFPWDADADLRTFAYLEEGDPSSVHVFERTADGTLRERCSVEREDLLLAELSMAPSGATILVVPPFPERQSPPPPQRFQGFLVRTRDCSVIALDGGPVHSLASRPRGGQMLLIRGDRVEIRSPRDGRVLGEFSREGAIAAGYSDDAASFALHDSREGRRYLRAADGSPAAAFEYPPYGEIPAVVGELPNGALGVLQAVSFTATDGLVLSVRSESGPSVRSAVRLTSEGAADACGPMTTAAERVAAIRRSLDCIATPGLRAVDRSADGRRALVYATDPAPEAQEAAFDDSTETSGDVHLYDVAAARLGARIPTLYSVSFFGEPIGSYAELSPDGRTLVIYLGSVGGIELLDARTGRSLARRSVEVYGGAGYLDARTLWVRTQDETLVLAARRALPELERRPLSTADDLERRPRPDGEATEDTENAFVFRAPNGTETRLAGRFLAASGGGRFVARCDGGTIHVDALDGSRPSTQAGSCGRLPELASVTLRDDGRVLSVTEGDRLVLRRVGGSDSLELRVFLVDGHRTIAIRDSAGHIAVLEGRAEDVRIRRAGDMLSAVLEPITESDEARESLRRMMATE